MKKFFTLLSLLLCFELIVSPVAPSLSLLGKEARAESCPQGFNWDATLNRCLTKTETANVMNATMNCGNDVECYKQNAQQAFQDKVNAGEAPERKKNKQFMSTIGNIAAIAGPVSMAAIAISGSASTCQSASFWTMVGGSAALVVGDNLANFQHKKRLKEIKAEWGKIVNPEQANGDKDKEREISIEAQSQSFEMLAKAEDSLAKAAKLKKTFFSVAALAYGASAIIAGLEIAADSASMGATKIGSICKAKDKPASDAKPEMPVEGNGARTSGIDESLFEYYTSPKTFNDLHTHRFHYNLSQSTDLPSFIVNRQAMFEVNSSPSLELYVSVSKAFEDTEAKDPEVFEIFKTLSLSMLHNLNPISVANAEEVKTNAAKAYKEDDGKGSNLLATAAGGLIVGGLAYKFIGNKMITPEARAIFSGVMAGWTMMMAKHAASQAEASTKRAELLRKMKGEFASASGAVYACQSEDRNDPAKPECYCYTVENQRNSNRGNSQVCQKLWSGKNFRPGNYNPLADSARTCINSAGAADSSCSCKTSKGGCMKVSLSSLKGINPGMFSMLSQALDPVNKISDGSLDAANVNSASLENQAARLADVNKKLEGSKALANYKKNKDKNTKDLIAGLTKASAGMSGNSLLGSSGSGSSFMPASAGEAASMLEKEIDDSEINKVEGNAGEIAAPDSKPSEDPALEFGMTQDQLVTQENQIAEVMKQDLDYGQSDINQGSTTNIFDVLSNRYQRSGMRRLFDEKGVTQPDKAAKTDITQ